MFEECNNLTEAPELPAKTLAEYCYVLMFAHCKNLTEAPELPATTLAKYCYRGMFLECTSLTEAPKLPATTLKTDCYFNMFEDCSSLKSVTCLATNISASGWTYDWLDGVSSTGTFIAPAETGWTTGASGIPSGWTRKNIEDLP